jgi:hypothetical protein
MLLFDLLLSFYFYRLMLDILDFYYFEDNGTAKV